MALVFVSMACAPAGPETLTTDARLDGDVVMVTGRALVHDGAEIEASAYHPARYGNAYSNVEVVDEEFSATLDLSGWPPGEVYVVASFWTTLQAEHVSGAYGPNGEGLRPPGPLVSNSDGPILEVVMTVVRSGPDS